MREIKFRAWLPDAKYKKGMFYQNHQYLSSFIRRIYDRYVVSHPTYLPFDLEERLTQYTGLKDKTGKEIYEGDVVAWLTNHGNMMTTGEVIFDKYQFNVKDFYDSSNDYPCDAFSEGVFEVVGNIYENPELLS